MEEQKPFTGLWLIVNFEAAGHVNQHVEPLEQPLTTDVDPESELQSELEAAFAAAKQRGFFIIADKSGNAMGLVPFERIVTMDIATSAHMEISRKASEEARRNAQAQQLDAMRGQGFVVGPDGIIMPPKRLARG